MTTATLDASVTRLETIKGNKHLYNKNKIAEAEALAAEALRMANEAKLAAARLAEVKKTLSMFSSKLEKAEQSVQKDTGVKTIPVVAKAISTEKSVDPVVVEAPKEEVVEKVDTVEEPAEEAPVVEAPAEEIPVEEAPVEEAPVEEAPVEEAPVEEAPAEEAPVVETPVEEVPAVETTDEPSKEEEQVEESKVDPPTASADIVSKNLVNNDVVKVVEMKQPATKAPTPAPKEPVATRETPAPVVPQLTQKKDIVEDFLDGLGVDKMCGVDDETLGFTDRPAPPPPAPEPPKVFENPTRVVYKSLSNEEYLHATSMKEEIAVEERQKYSLPAKQYQRSLVNEEFADPFGVDHDDLVLCGKIADTCEPPEYDEEFDP